MTYAQTPNAREKSHNEKVVLRPFLEGQGLQSLADGVETPLFGGYEVLREFSRPGNLVCQKFINAAILYNAPGLSK